MNKIMALRWQDVTLKHRYQLFSKGKVTLSQIKANPIVKTYIATGELEIEILTRLGFTEIGETESSDHNQVWQDNVELDLSVD